MLGDVGCATLAALDAVAVDVGMKTGAAGFRVPAGTEAAETEPAAWLPFLPLCGLSASSMRKSKLMGPLIIALDSLEFNPSFGFSTPTAGVS